MMKGRAPTAVEGAAPGAVQPTPRKPARRTWVAAGGVVLLVAAALVAVNIRSTDAPKTTAADVNGIVDEKLAQVIEDLQSLPPHAVAVYEAIRLPMVMIRPERPTPTPAIGSGVIVNARGDILTSLHVVEGASSIRVSFSDGTETSATVVGADPAIDIAVLTPARLPDVVVPAVLGGGAQIGDEAFVVGHPLGLRDSLTVGVISGIDRSFRMTNGRTLTGMIQFDAAVNPGNSGGPLLNRNGQVIGIVTGLANNSGDDNFIGIGFAVPIGTAGGAAGAPAR